MLSCTAPYLLRASDLAAACIQAEATLQSAAIQASAARDAGAMTLAAGAMALFAAIVGAAATIHGVRKQILCARDLQLAEQKHTVKKEVYMDAATSLAVSLMTIGRFADVRIPFDKALEQHQAEAPKLHRIHLVAPMNVLKAVMTASEAVAKIHIDLVGRRMGMGFLPPPEYIAMFGRYCLSKIPELMPVMSEALQAMRGDLGMEIDRQAYDKLMEEVADAVRKAADPILKRVQSQA
jgi:hypothetical protein